MGPNMQVWQIIQSGGHVSACLNKPDAEVINVVQHLLKSQCLNVLVSSLQTHLRIILCKTDNKQIRHYNFQCAHACRPIVRHSCTHLALIYVDHASECEEELSSGWTGLDVEGR